jgi:hypothetical protein
MSYEKTRVGAICLMLSVYILCVLLSSCFQVTSNVSREITAQTTTPLASILLSPTSEITPSGASQSNIDLTNKCIDINSSLNAPMDGSIILKSMFTNEVSLVDMKSGLSKPLGQLFPNIAVSPDFTRVAFVTERTHQLIILDAQAEELEAKTVSPDFGGVVQWVDSERLVLEKFTGSPYREASSVLYNIFSGEEEEYEFDYPDMSAFVNEIRWGNHGFYSHGI